MKTVEWRGLPVWVSAPDTGNAAVDPKRSTAKSRIQSRERTRIRRRNMPATNTARCKPEYLVAVGICTHLGCNRRSGPFASGPNSQLGADQGFVCPCHGSTFDLAGRVFKNKPAPDNLPIPPYKYLSETRSC